MRLHSTILTLLLSLAACAAEPVKPVKLDFGELEVVQMAVAPGSPTLFLLATPGAGEPLRLYAYDWESHKMLGEVRVPRSPIHMLMVGDELALSCPDARVVAVLSTATREVVSAFEPTVRKSSWPPDRLYPDRERRLIVSCGWSDEEGISPYLIRLDLETGKMEGLAQDQANHLAVSREFVVFQDGPDRQPRKHSTWDALEDWPSSHRLPEALDRGDTYSSLQVIQDGRAFLWSRPGGTFCYSESLERELWSRPGTWVFSMHPAGSTGIVISRDRQAFTGLDLATGNPLWSVQCEKLTRHPTFLEVSLGPTAVMTTGERDALVFAVPPGRADRRNWHGCYWLPLPAAPAVVPRVTSDPPPLEIRAESEFRHPLEVASAPPGMKFLLRDPPHGMQIGRESGEITWTPDLASIGEHAVVVLWQTGSEPKQLYQFKIRVRPPR